eukprot:304692_1
MEEEKKQNDYLTPSPGLAQLEEMPNIYLGMTKDEFNNQTILIDTLDLDEGLDVYWDTNDTLTSEGMTFWNEEYKNSVMDRLDVSCHLERSCSVSNEPVLDNNKNRNKHIKFEADKTSEIVEININDENKSNLFETRSLQKLKRITTKPTVSKGGYIDSDEDEDTRIKSKDIGKKRKRNVQMEISGENEFAEKQLKDECGQKNRKKDK